MPRPKINALYALWPSRLHQVIANPQGEIPVRVLSATAWVLPVYGRDTQPHQALPQARFRGPADPDRDYSAPAGLLVCWALDADQETGAGVWAARGPEAIRRLRDFPRPDLRQTGAPLLAGLRAARLEIDVVSPDLLNIPITETS